MATGGKEELPVPHDVGDLKLSSQAKDQLVGLKRYTGVKNWNVLCRWALCMSLADSSPPLVRQIVPDSNVEMTWKTFAGRDEYAYYRLLLQRNSLENLYNNDLSKVLHVHVHRGIGMLAGLGIRKPEELATLAHVQTQ